MSDTVAEEQDQLAEEVVDEIVADAEVGIDEQQDNEADDAQTEQSQEEKMVPLSALKKVRRESQEEKMRRELLERELATYRQTQQQAEPQVDNSNDLLTVGEQNKTLHDWKRSILEEAYMEQNPDIVERIRDELPKILSDPKNQWLADSLKSAPNRLQRGAQILDMFKPKRHAVPPPDRSKTPRSPQTVAKTNKLTAAERFMEMSDQELEEWRLSQKRKSR